MPKAKSPGLDGIPPELIIVLWDVVGPAILNSINHSFISGTFHRDQKTALITLLLKKGKDPLECASYRPLSLLNCDFKLYAKFLSRRLDTVISHLVHPDQAGFIKGRLASDNIRRLLHVIEFSSAQKQPCAVLSLDAEKAFDRVEWDYLWAVLEHLGFGPLFIRMIRILYADPTARVQTGHPGASEFMLYRSTRQGCPLSPGLFALSLEPLAQAVRQHQNISSISIKGTTHSISLYADNILIYLSDVANSVPHVLNLFEEFGSFSGYKINWSKSLLMPLNLAAKKLTLSSLPIDLEHNGFTYLGIQIRPSLSSIVKDNFNLALAKI